MKSGVPTDVLRLAFVATLSALTGAAADNAPAADPAPAEVAKSDHPPAANESPAKPKAPAPKPRPRLSPEIAAQLVAGVPPWAPPPPEQKPPAAPPPADAEVVPMKPVIVRGDRLPPRIDDKEWLTPKARTEVLTKQYLSDFDRTFLNRFTLPIIGISKEARAQMMYEEEKRLQDLKWMDDQIESAKKVDAAAAKDLTTIRDETFTRQESP